MWSLLVFFHCLAQPCQQPRLSLRTWLNCNSPADKRMILKVYRGDRLTCDELIKYQLNPILVCEELLSPLPGRTLVWLRPDLLFSDTNKHLALTSHHHHHPLTSHHHHHPLNSHYHHHPLTSHHEHLNYLHHAPVSSLWKFDLPSWRETSWLLLFHFPAVLQICWTSPRPPGMIYLVILSRLPNKYNSKNLV